MTTRPRRWRREDAARRATARRMLTAGAVLATIVAFAAQRVLRGDVGGDTRQLMNLAMLVPVGVYMLWWALAPGISLGARHHEAGASAVDSEDARKRARTVEGATQQAHAASDKRFAPIGGARQPDALVREQYIGSVGRPGGQDTAAASFQRTVQSIQVPPAPADEPGADAGELPLAAGD